MHDTLKRLIADKVPDEKTFRKIENDLSLEVKESKPFLYLKRLFDELTKLYSEKSMRVKKAIIDKISQTYNRLPIVEAKWKHVVNNAARLIIDPDMKDWLEHFPWGRYSEGKFEEQRNVSDKNAFLKLPQEVRKQLEDVKTEWNREVKKGQDWIALRSTFCSAQDSSATLKATLKTVVEAFIWLLFNVSKPQIDAFLEKPFVRPCPTYLPHTNDELDTYLEELRL